MKVEVKDWFGLLELYFIIETFRPWMARWNSWARSSTPAWAVFIVDHKFWRSIEADQ